MWASRRRHVLGAKLSGVSLPDGIMRTPWIFLIPALLTLACTDNTAPDVNADAYSRPQSFEDVEQVQSTSVTGQAQTSVTLPRKGDIQAAGAKVGNYWMSGHTSGSNDNGWTGGVLMAGIIEHWRKYATASYKTYALNWANAYSWKLISSGCDRLGNWHNRMTAGYTYLRLLQGGVAGATVADVTRNLDKQLALPISPEVTGLVNYKFPGCASGTFSWKAVDAEFMALPVWITMGKHLGNSNYYARVRDLQAYQVAPMGLQDATTKLWYRDESYKTATSPKGLKIFWGRGEGWIAAGLAIALSELPTSRPEYATYRTRFVDLMNALRARQRADGFWNMNVADPNHYPAPETSATALITFATATGINLGILDATTYKPVAAKAWNAMVASSIRNDGYLGYCQGTGLAPVPPSDPTYPDEGSTSAPCVGAFLLAGTAINRLSTTLGTTAAIIYEAEAMATSVSAGDSQTDITSNYASGGGSNSATLNAVNDYVQFTATNVPAGSYKLRVRFRRSPNNGIWQLTTNGVNTGTATDGYDVDPHYAEADFGNVTYSTTANRVYRFKVTGKRTASSGYGIAIDCIKLVRL
jgi:unsaturated rhamnogalacturonyl hydrolase